MGGEEPATQPELTLKGLETALANVVRAGLPVRAQDVQPPLLQHRGVIARAVVPDDFFSLLAACNDVLKRLLRRWHREAERAALLALFGIEKGYRGATLTRRRERAAEHLSYDATHFRKEVEPKLVTAVTQAFYQDHLKYSPRTRYAPPPIEASGDTPTIGPGDYNEQEELVSRIWSEVYGLRAEILLAGRLKRDPEAGVQLEDARGQVLIRTGRMLSLIEQYKQTYGDRILAGGTEWDVEGLIRLAGWRGGVPTRIVKGLRLGASR